MNPIKTIIAIALIATGCGRVQYYTERELDPDTVEAIKKHNMAQVEGDWLYVEDQKYFYFSLHGDEYSAVIKSGDRVLASDSGRIIHEIPDVIFFKSRLSGCTAGKREVVAIQFGKDENGLLRVADPDSPWAFSMKSSEPQEIPRANLCLWNLSEKGRLRLKI